MTTPFTADYYLNGPSTGLSNYENYRWMPEQSIPCAARMMRLLGARFGDTVHEVGCARGYGVKALRILGFNATGNDISDWAIENCDPDVKQHVSKCGVPSVAQWIIAKDTAEHVPVEQMTAFLDSIIRAMKCGALIIVPLGDDNSGTYRAPQDNADKTHVICWDMAQWLHRIQDRIEHSNRDLVVSGAYKLKGVKQACDPYPESVAFIVIKQL